MNHYSKIGEKAEHPAKILIPKHFPLLRKPNNSNKLSINFNVFNNENFPNETKNVFGSVFKGDKQVRNSFLRSLGKLVKYKEYMLSSTNDSNQNYPLQGNNFYRESEYLSEGTEEKYRDPNFEHMTNNFTGKKSPFNNQSKNLVPTKFPLHSNITNSFLSSNLTTEQNLIKGNYLNEQVTIEKKDEAPEYLRLLLKNGGIYKKLIKKYNV